MNQKSEVPQKQYCDRYLILSKGHFIWKIHNFSLYTQKCGEYIESLVFTSSGEFEKKWKLQLNPAGKMDYEDSVGLYLCSADNAHEKISVDVTFSIIKKDGSLYSRPLIKQDFESNWGYNQFIERSKLLEKKNGFLQDDDTLCIECKVKSSIGISEQRIPNSCDFKTTNTYQEMSQDFRKLLKDDKFSDLCIKVDGVEFKVHKIILAARSPVFAAMLEHNMKENQENIIQIVDFKPEIIKEMISYIYTCEVQDLEAKALELLKAADKYDLSGLKVLCEHAICKSLSIDNVMDILIVADLVNSQVLKKSAINFIEKNLKDIVQLPSFLAFSGPNSCLIEIFKYIATKNV